MGWLQRLFGGTPAGTDKGTPTAKASGRVASDASSRPRETRSTTASGGRPTQVAVGIADTRRSMLDSLSPDPHFAVHPKYADIFSRLVSNDTRGEACRSFEEELRGNRVEALMTVLAWKGNCDGMGCNSFIFPMYDAWFSPLTPNAIWKVHIATGGLDVPASSTKFVLMPLAQVIGEAVKAGETHYVDELKQATPPGAEEHFRLVREAVRKLMG